MAVFFSLKNPHNPWSSRALNSLRRGAAQLGSGSGYLEIERGTRGPVRRMAETLRDLFFSRLRLRIWGVGVVEKAWVWVWDGD